MAILVCGGAGYIGSHAVQALLGKGERVIVADNLSTGFARAVPPGAVFRKVDMRDGEGLDALFREHSIRAVMHFAASSQVGESVLKPHKYFDNNIHGALSLLGAMERHGVRPLIFSSTAAVYGMADHMPITETAPLAPVNPYGESKLCVERMLEWLDRAGAVRSVALRYFNVAGAHPGGHIGEAHEPETHLVPLVLEVPLGKRQSLTVFGQDYDTPDGTCIRDYIHVSDVVDAHLLALEYLEKGGPSDHFNLGNGQGFSVKEILEAAERVTGASIAFTVGPRRAGDPPRLVASSEKARSCLGWVPKFVSVEEIIRSAWEWHRGHPYGYDK